MVLRGTKRIDWHLGLVILVSVLCAFTGYKLFAHDSVRSSSDVAPVLAADCNNPANATVAENCLPGTDGWQQIDHSLSIEIYASTESVNVGGKISFFVDSQAGNFDLNIYRIGYYGGIGARLIQSIPNLAGGDQPDCIRVEDTGLRTCSNWRNSYSLDVPADWVSGVYMARVVQPATGSGNETVFAVRQDDRKSAMLYQMSVTTLQAYNNYGGKSLYSVNSGTCDTVANAPRAVKVSLNRPYSATFQDPNYFYRAEYPMVRWLEQQGYDVGYSTNMDTHRSGLPGAHNALLDHKIFLSVGHDEYWSQPMSDAITAARDAGVNIAVFSSNTSYWRIRFEPDPVTNEPDSVMVTYKSTESGNPDPSGEPTGTWRDPRGANKPENAFLGVMYIGDNDKMYFPLRLSSEYTSDPLFRHTGLQKMPPNTYIDVGDQIIGWEWDAAVDNGAAPQGLQILAKTPVYGFLLQDAGRSENGNMGQAFTNTTRYVAPGGAMVFASSTIQWSWGLGAHAIDVVPPDPYITQITYNLFSDMGVQPATPADNLIIDGSDTPDLPLPADRIKTEGSVKGPTISDIQVTTDDNGTTIKWTTDVESTGQLWYGLQPDHIINTGGIETKLSTSHEFTLTGLSLGQTYYFKAASVNADWGQTISDANSFVTATGSITQRLRGAVEPVIRKGGCWVRANQTGSIIIAVLGVTIVVLLIAPTIILRRRRQRMVRAQA